MVLVQVFHISKSSFQPSSYNMRIFLLCFAEEFDSYIIVSFVNATLVLSIGETVEEVTDSGFLGTTPTLSCSLLGEDALLQVLLIIFLLRRRYPIQGRTQRGGGQLYLRFLECH